MNSEIWSSVPGNAKSNDTALQKIQSHLVKNVTAVTSVIDKLNKIKGEVTSENFDVDDIIKTLVDAVAFSGSANRAIVRKRKEAVKFCLAPKFQKLCAKDDFTPTSLFGENLAQNVKEINDFGKITKDIAKPGPSNQSGFSQRGRGGFRGRGVLRGWGYPRRDFYLNRRYSPYPVHRPIRGAPRGSGSTRPGYYSKQSNSNTPRGKGGNSSSA